MTLRFSDRFDAGRRLAIILARYAGLPHLIVLALPRGGVPVGYEVARALQAPLDVMPVRKLGVPGHEELAMGAIASGGVRVISDIVWTLGIPEPVISNAAAREQHQLERQERAYRNDRPAADIKGRTVILVDDGVATGSSMRAAVSGLKAKHPAHLVVAAPVAAGETCESLRHEVDEVVCTLTPRPFLAVGQWYNDFSQFTDEEVRKLLLRAADDLVAVPSSR